MARLGIFLVKQTMQSAVVLLYIRILKDRAPPFGLLDTMMDVALRFGFRYHEPADGWKRAKRHLQILHNGEG